MFAITLAAGGLIDSLRSKTKGATHSKGKGLSRLVRCAKSDMMSSLVKHAGTLMYLSQSLSPDKCIEAETCCTVRCCENNMIDWIIISRQR